MRLQVTVPFTHDHIELSYAPINAMPHPTPTAGVGMGKGFANYAVVNKTTPMGHSPRVKAPPNPYPFPTFTIYNFHKLKSINKNKQGVLRNSCSCSKSIPPVHLQTECPHNHRETNLNSCHSQSNTQVHSVSSSYIPPPQ